MTLPVGHYLPVPLRAVKHVKPKILQFVRFPRRMLQPPEGLDDWTRQVDSSRLAFLDKRFQRRAHPI